MLSLLCAKWPHLVSIVEEATMLYELSTDSLRWEVVNRHRLLSPVADLYQVFQQVCGLNTATTAANTVHDFNAQTSAPKVSAHSEHIEFLRPTSIYSQTLLPAYERDLRSWPSNLDDKTRALPASRFHDYWPVCAIPTYLAILDLLPKNNFALRVLLSHLLLNGDTAGVEAYLRAGVLLTCAFIKLDVIITRS